MASPGMIFAFCLTIFVMGVAYLIQDVMFRVQQGRKMGRRIDRLAGNLSAEEDMLLDPAAGFDLIPEEQKKGLFASFVPDMPSFAKYVEQARSPTPPTRSSSASPGSAFWASSPRNCCGSPTPSP